MKSFQIEIGNFNIGCLEAENDILVYINIVDFFDWAFSDNSLLIGCFEKLQTIRSPDTTKEGYMQLHDALSWLEFLNHNELDSFKESVREALQGTVDEENRNSYILLLIKS